MYCTSRIGVGIATLWINSKLRSEAFVGVDCSFEAGDGEVMKSLFHFNAYLYHQSSSDHLPSCNHYRARVKDQVMKLGGEIGKSPARSIKCQSMIG